MKLSGPLRPGWVRVGHRAGQDSSEGASTSIATHGDALLQRQRAGEPRGHLQTLLFPSCTETTGEIPGTLLAAGTGSGGVPGSSLTPSEPGCPARTHCSEHTGHAGVRAAMASKSSSAGKAFLSKPVRSSHINLNAKAETKPLVSRVY